MLEIAIAVGIGIWFFLCGIFSFWAVSKTFRGKGDKE
jgi:hypothetical protein